MPKRLLKTHRQQHSAKIQEAPLASVTNSSPAALHRSLVEQSGAGNTEVTPTGPSMASRLLRAIMHAPKPSLQYAASSVEHLTKDLCFRMQLQQ